MELRQTNPKTFNFKSGVAIETNKDKVTATALNYNKTIQSSDLDNFSYVDHLHQRLTFWGLLARLFAIGLLFLIFSKAIFQKLNLETQATYLGVLLVGLSFLGLILFVIDITLELGIMNSVINQFFSNKSYYVTIGNKSANNIEFYALLEDLELIKELESEIYELKKLAVKNDTLKVYPKSTNLDELKKLAKLLNSGIITQTEFDQKKKQLLELN